MSIEVTVQRAAPGERVPAPARIRGWAAAAAGRFRARAELTVRVVGAAEGARLNAEYRGGTGATNVLAFPFEPPPGGPAPAEAGGPEPLGDVVVCAPVAAAEARRQGKRPEHHWAHLVVHGVLHLLGFDHASPGEARRMEHLERAILESLGVPDPYAEPGGEEGGLRSRAHG